MDRWELVSAFMNQTQITIGGIKGRIQFMELEDGGGYNFNVRIAGMKLTPNTGFMWQEVKETLFVRCRQ